MEKERRSNEIGGTVETAMPAMNGAKRRKENRSGGRGEGTSKRICDLAGTRRRPRIPDSAPSRFPPVTGLSLFSRR